MSIDQLTAEAMALPPEKRLELADALYVSVPIADDEFNPEYLQEIQRRIEELETGKVKGIPHEEVMREMWRIANAAD